MPISTPAIFFGHGNPMNAIEVNQYTKEWIELMKPIQKPKAVLAISAHWETNGTKITNNLKQKTIHDFGGFPRELFNVQYNPDGDQNLVKRIQDLAPEAIPDDSWGLDHGTWSILKHIYPKADVPVVQLSIDVNKSEKQHFELAQRLRSLRDENILIIGSGNIVHNLRLIDWNGDSCYSWAHEFNDSIKQAILKKNFDSIINYKKLKGSKESVPSNEHFIPLLYILGLQRDNEKPTFFTDQMEMGSLSMTGVIFH